MIRPVLATSFVTVFWLLPLSAAGAADEVAGTLITFNDNGGWSWFEDERAIVDPLHGKILVSSIANGSGTDGAQRAGDIDVVSYDLATGEVRRFTLCRELEADDHNSAALLQLPDGRYLASYSKHSSDNRLRYRVSLEPGDASAWQAEQVFNTVGGTTYSNLCYLSENSTVFNFHRDRGLGFDPNYLIWNYRQASGFSYGGRLLTGPEGNDGNRDRPYVRYVSNGRNRIDFVTSDAHPRNLRRNRVYHGYLEQRPGKRMRVCRTDGTFLGELSSKPSSPYKASDFSELSPLLRASSSDRAEITRLWPTDIELDQIGQPCIVFTGRVNDRDDDHRFFYARFSKGSWQVRELASAGRGLYAAENDYTGLAAIDPQDANRVFISTNIDPTTYAPLQHYEIFEGITTNLGAVWSWTPITFDSSEDNLRPIVPKSSMKRTVLLWMRGQYRSYTDYSTHIVGLLEHSQPAD